MSAQLDGSSPPPHDPPAPTLGQAPEQADGPHDAPLPLASPSVSAPDAVGRATDDGPPEPQSAAAVESLAEQARARAAALAAQFTSQASSAGLADGDDPLGKRRLDGDLEGDEPGAKRAAYDYSGGYSDQPLPGPPGGLHAPAAAGALASEVIMCPADKVGKVIGRAGATIKELQDRTNTRIQVDHKAPTADKPVTVSGLHDDVARCKQLILDLFDGLDAGLSSTSGAAVGPPGVGDGEPRTIECPHGIVGRIIGRGGETIRSLQQASGAHILINQDFPEGVPRQIIITGKPDAIDRAAKMVSELIAGDPGSTQTVVQKYGLGQTEHMECPKPMVGRIIGKSGETIKGLQKQFNVSIQIDQTSAPCRVTITGPVQQLGAARRAIEDLINPMGGGGFGGPRPPFMPGAGGGGGGGFGGYGGYSAGAYPMQGYGGYAPPPFAAGFPSGYNPGYPAAPAGFGYGAYASAGIGGAQADPYASAYAAGGAAGAAAPAAAAGAGAPAAASGLWQALQDDQGRTYYYNTQTGHSQWEKPDAMP